MSDAMTQHRANNDESVVIERSELQDELSWLMSRVHRIRRLLGLEPITTPRRKRRQQNK